MAPSQPDYPGAAAYAAPGDRLAGYAFIATHRYGGLPEAFPFSIYTPRRLMKLGKFRFPWAMATTSTNQFIAR